MWRQRTSRVSPKRKPCHNIIKASMQHAARRLDREALDQQRQQARDIVPAQARRFVPDPGRTK